MRQSKYENAGPFPDELVLRAVQVIRERYPLGKINGIVSMPPTKSGKLVEVFARRVADMLHIRYLPVLAKARVTDDQ